MTVANDLNNVERRAERENDHLNEQLMYHIESTRRVAADEADKIRRELVLAFHNHEQVHAVVDNNLEEFKISVREQLDNILRTLDQAREDRAHFVTRDASDAKTDGIEKQLIALEKQLVEKNDLALKQMSDTITTKQTTNSDRITKIEQGIQVMNARNQQSIIALGVLLTVVEILIRFFTN